MNEEACLIEWIIREFSDHVEIRKKPTNLSDNISIVHFDAQTVILLYIPRKDTFKVLVFPKRIIAIIDSRGLSNDFSIPRNDAVRITLKGLIHTSYGN